jgi:hypothetical protein
LRWGGNNLLEFYYLGAYEICPDKRGGLIRERLL